MPKSQRVKQLSNNGLQAQAERKPPMFYVVDWLPPDFGAVGQMP
jgi:hypothetical protein